MSEADDIDEVWIGMSVPLLKIGLAIDCWTSYVAYPYGLRGTDALKEINPRGIKIDAHS